MIDFEEFLFLMTRKMKQGDTEDEIKEAFAIFDKDRDGYLNHTEMRYVLSNMVTIRSMYRPLNMDDWII